MRGPGTREDADERLLERPLVPPQEYDSDYFLVSCMGADAWRESDGANVAGLYAGMLERIGMRRGSRVLDVGTGRGELPRVAVEWGAQRAMGIDYSADAVRLAQETIRRSGCDDRVQILQADARSVPAPDRSFDLVTMLDVVEHLSPGELADALDEARRVLVPGGEIFVHTAPTSVLYEVTYRLQRLGVPTRWRTWPKDPRKALERRMHVNEQRLGTLRRALRRAGFERVRVGLGDWVYTDFVPQPRAKRLYWRLSRVPWLRRFGVADLYARAARPGGT